MCITRLTNRGETFITLSTFFELILGNLDATVLTLGGDVCVGEVHKSGEITVVAVYFDVLAHDDVIDIYWVIWNDIMGL